MRCTIACVTLMHIFTISAVTIVGMLEPETVAIFVFSESLLPPNARCLVAGGGGGGGGGIGAGSGKFLVMVEGGCSVAVNHGV